MGVLASDYVSILSSLTLRPDLQFLTFLPWASVLTIRSLLKQNRSWCPGCYDHWRDEKMEIYEPLLWTLKEIDVCIIHRKPLLNECPHCRQTQLWLGPLYCPGYCIRCGAWLGSKHESAEWNGSDTSEGECEFQLWAVDALGEVLAESSSSREHLSHETLAKSLMTCLQRVAGGDITTFTEAIGKPRECVRTWTKRGKRPTLGTILEICRLSDVSPLQYLTGRITHVDKGDGDNKATRVVRRPGRTPAHVIESHLADLLQVFEVVLTEEQPRSMLQVAGKIREEYGVSLTLLYDHLPDLCRAVVARHAAYQEKKKLSIKKLLEEVIESKEEPPPSLYRVFVRKGYKYRHSVVWREFPDLCKVISDHYREYKKARQKQRKELLREEVRQAALELHKRGIYPSALKVGKLLSVPSRVRNKRGRSVLREEQNILGVLRPYRGGRVTGDC